MIFDRKMDAQKHLSEVGYKKDHSKWRLFRAIPHKLHDRMMIRGNDIAVISNVGKGATIRGFYTIEYYRIEMMNLRKNDHLYVMFRSMTADKKECLMVGKINPPLEPCKILAIADDIGWINLDEKKKFFTKEDVAKHFGFEVVG